MELGECVQCHRPVKTGRDGEYLELDGKLWCGADQCAAEYGLMNGWGRKYEKSDTQVSFVAYVRGHLTRYRRIPSEADMESIKGDIDYHYAKEAEVV